MQAASNNGTTQTQAHRSHGVGSNPENGGVEQLPAEVTAEVFSHLSLYEQLVAMSAAPASLRDRVAPHIEPSIKQLGEALAKAAREGRLEEVQVFLDKYQMANISKAVKNIVIVFVLEGAIRAGQLRVASYILSNVELDCDQLLHLLVLAGQYNIPELFRAIAIRIDFTASDIESGVLWQIADILRTHQELFQCAMEVIGPHLTDENFQEVMGRPRRLSENPGGCILL